MKKFDIDGHEPSFLPDGADWKLVWSDEFDGTELDRTKWDFRLNFWGKRFPAYTDEGIVLDGKSNLEMHIIKKDGKFVSPQLQTGANTFDAPKEIHNDKQNACGDNHFWPIGTVEKPRFMHRFGYYEIRCKFQSQPHWWSAFWLQAPATGTSYDPKYSGVEVDIMECFKRNGEVTSGNFYGGYGNGLKSDCRTYYTLDETDNGFHRFGVHWTENEYVFYCDGKETARTSWPVSHVEQFILLTTEVQGYRKGDGTKNLPELEDIILPDCFTVDYVRVFDEVK